MAARFNWRRGLGPSLLVIAATVGYAAWISRGHSSPQPDPILGDHRRSGAGRAGAGACHQLSGADRPGGPVAFDPRRGHDRLSGRCLLVRRRVGRTVFTNKERAPFVAVDRNGERRLLHPALGFSILHPGAGLVPSASQAYGANAHFYVFTDQAGGEALTVGLFKGFGGSSASLQGPSRGDGQAGRRARRQDGRSRAGRSSGGARHQSTACGAPRDHRRRPALPAERLRLEAPGQSPLAVVIAMMSSGADAHSDVLASFQP